MTNHASTDMRKSQGREATEAIRAIHDMVKQFQLIDPLKEIRQTLKVMEMADPFKQLREAIQLIQVHNPLREVQRAIEAIRQLPDPLHNLRESINIIQTLDPLKSVRESIQQIQLLARSAPVQEAMRGIDAYRQFLQTAIPANFFEETFREAVARYAKAETEAGAGVDDAAQNLVGEIEHDVQSVPKTRLSLEFWLNLLIAISILIYSMKLSELSEDRLSRQIHAMQQVILKQIVSQGTELAEQTYYIVERKTSLLSKPKPRKSSVVTTLYPNQKVRLVSKRGKWICAEYFNYLTNLHENGWCMVKYLKRVETAKMKESSSPNDRVQLTRP